MSKRNYKEYIGSLNDNEFPKEVYKFLEESNCTIINKRPEISYKGEIGYVDGVFATPKGNTVIYETITRKYTDTARIYKDERQLNGMRKSIHPKKSIIIPLINEGKIREYAHTNFDFCLKSYPWMGNEGIGVFEYSRCSLIGKIKDFFEGI